MPTNEASERFLRAFAKLTRADQRRFDAARRRFAAGLEHHPPVFDPRLRVKRVRSRADVWDITWAPDGRATFRYGDTQRPGKPHVMWLEIGDHSILA